MMHLCFAPLLRVSCFSSKLARCFADSGVTCLSHVIGYDCFKLFCHRIFTEKFANALPSRIVLPVTNRRLINAVSQDDILWVYTDAELINPWADFAVEKACQKKGCRYVFQLPDAWPLANSRVKEACKRRVGCADLVLAVTPQLAEVLREQFPNASVDVAEEAIDTDSVLPINLSVDNSPSSIRILCVNLLPRKLKELERLAPILERVYDRHPFRFRVVSGEKKPNLSIKIPWEWEPYHQYSPHASYHGTSVALAMYGDSPYDKCKGNYKVKTFMAMGIPVITNNAGYNQVLIKDQIDGFLVNGVDDWEKTILRVLDASPALLREMGLRARKKVVDRYSYPATVEAYVKVLQKHFPKELEKCRISTREAR